MPLQNLLKAIHDTAQWLLHICLIPVITVLKAIEAGVTHLVTELSKV